MAEIYDVIIIGAGPAGLAAALYTGRARLRTLILEKELMGGELINRELIENYPGYPNGIMGPELGSNMLNQTINYGAEIQLDEVQQIRIESGLKKVRSSQEEYQGKGIIIAAGAHPKKLGVPGEEEFADKGVFYCATCDGPGFANKVVAVAGGGDSGVTEALILANYVAKVIIIEVLPQCTASRILQERAQSNPKVQIISGCAIEAIQGDDTVRAIDVKDVVTGEKASLSVDGLLVHVGLEANTDYLRGTIPMDKRGQILVNERMETEISGVLAAGDIRHNSLMQITTAVGDGVTAALSIGKYLSKL